MGWTCAGDIPRSPKLDGPRAEGHVSERSDVPLPISERPTVEKTAGAIEMWHPGKKSSRGDLRKTRQLALCWSASINSNHGANRGDGPHSIPTNQAAECSHFVLMHDFCSRSPSSDVKFSTSALESA